MQKVLSEDKRTFLAANLTELQSEEKVGYRGKNRFSCNTGIAQKVWNTNDAIEAVRNPSTDLFNSDGAKYDESAITTEDGTNYFNNFPTTFNSAEWIVQGSDAVDPIQVKEETVATPSNLQEIAKNTQHPKKQSIFDQFPTGESQGDSSGGVGDDGEGDSAGTIRNPYSVCADVLNVCP